MDCALASIFINPATEQSWPQRNGDESPAELQYNLMCASIELQNAKAAAKAEEKFQQAKLCHLQELLSITKEERDKAREESQKLKVCLSCQNTTSIPSSSVVYSPFSPCSLHEEHLNSDNFWDSLKTLAPTELQQTLESFSQNFNEGLQALFSIEPTCDSVLEDSEQQFSLEVLEQDLSFDVDPSLNLVELEQDEKGIYESTQPTCSLSWQSFSNSSSASVQTFQQMHSPMDFKEVPVPVLSPVTVMGTDVVANALVSDMGNNASFPVALSNDSNAISVMGNLPLNSSSSPQLNPILHAPEVSSCMRTTPVDAQAFAGSPMASHTNSTHVRQVHLPEPPEADPQVIPSSLPEKGKLLHAVMQAGPLLQTLLLAGPLPQWCHPPPNFSTGDIPKVSILPSNVILPDPSHLQGPLMQGHVKHHTPISNAGFSPTTRVQVVNADPCSRPKKLRKLSPASPHQSQIMHMKCGEGMIKAGVSYPPTIY